MGEEIDSTRFSLFETALVGLFERYGVRTFAFAVLVVDDKRDGVTIRQMANVVGSLEQGRSASKVAGVMVEQLAETQMSLLCRYNGLSVEQAEGALRATARVAASRLLDSEEAPDA